MKKVLDNLREVVILKVYLVGIRGRLYGLPGLTGD